MFTNSKQKSHLSVTRKRWQESILIVILIFLACGTQISYGEPYLAFKTNNKCSACHVNPIGGGARNSYGAYYGSQVLPETLGNIENVDGGNISSAFRLGGDLRVNYDQRNSNGGGDNSSNEGKSFNTQSGQLYFALQPKGSKFLLYIDQQVAPGSTLNREAFVLAKLKGNHYLKAGNIMLPYGLRLEDDSAFIRQASQINFDNSDNGVELGLEYSRATFNFAVTNGSNSSSNDDENFQYAFRGEYLGNHWRVGGSAIVNDAELGQRTLANVFGGFNWGGFVFLAEVDRIEDDSVTSVTGESEVKLASFFEVNKEVARGYNLKFTTEYLDPDDSIDENESTRHSAVLEYTPYPYMQIRGGLRRGDDIPQRDSGNFTDVFVQLHMYY